MSGKGKAGSSKSRKRSLPLTPLPTRAVWVFKMFLRHTGSFQFSVRAPTPKPGRQRSSEWPQPSCQPRLTPEPHHIRHLCSPGSLTRCAFLGTAFGLLRHQAASPARAGVHIEHGVPHSENRTHPHGCTGSVERVQGGRDSRHPDSASLHSPRPPTQLIPQGPSLSSLPPSLLCPGPASLPRGHGCVSFPLGSLPDGLSLGGFPSPSLHPMSSS